MNQSVKDAIRFGLPTDSTPVLYRENSSEGESTIKYDLTIATHGLGKVQVDGSSERPISMRASPIRIWPATGPSTWIGS